MNLKALSDLGKWVMALAKKVSNFFKIAYYSALRRNNMLFVPGEGNRYRWALQGVVVVASGYTLAKRLGSKIGKLKSSG